jgi:hypothetical protein
MMLAHYRSRRIALKPVLGESQDLAGLTLQQASELLRSKAASPVDLTCILVANNKLLVRSGNITSAKCRIDGFGRRPY